MRSSIRAPTRGTLLYRSVTANTAWTPSPRPTCFSLTSPLNHPGTLQQQQRHYATDVSRQRSKLTRRNLQPSRSSDAGPKLINPHDPFKRVLTAEMVPSLDFFEQYLPTTGCTDLTPSQLHIAAQLFCDGTTLRDVAWAKRLVASSGGKVTPYILHHLAVALQYGGQEMAFSVLHTAAMLDYTPSILEMVNRYYTVAESRSSPKRAEVPPVFLASIKKFDALVSAGQNPDALALKGHVLSLRGQKEEAGRWYLKARRVGMQLYPGAYATPPTAPVPQVRAPRWFHEQECHVLAGRALLGIGKVEEAKTAFAFAAFELDDAVGLAEYAQLMPEEVPERREFLLSAAVSGAPQASTEMGKTELWLATQERLTEVERSWHRLIGKEWIALAQRAD